MGFNNDLPSFLFIKENRSAATLYKKKQTFPFIDNTVKNVSRFIKTVYVQGDTASKKGLLQQLNARIKVFFLLSFILIISIAREIPQECLITFFLLILFIASRINLIEVYKKIVLFSFFFGFLIIAPASLNVVTNGEMLFSILRFNSAHNFWIYHIPAIIGVTHEGCIVVIRFYLKVTNSIALSLLVCYTTPFNEIIKSFGTLKVPQLFLMVITLSYKFIFILSQTTEETYLALKSRWWKYSVPSDANNLVAGRISYIFRKSWIKYEEIYKAMVARGFSGKVNLGYVKRIRWQDVAFLVVIVAVALVYFYI
jgi:cobalt/nickel transport system permease protein